MQKIRLLGWLFFAGGRLRAFSGDFRLDGAADAFGNDNGRIDDRRALPDEAVCRTAAVAEARFAADGNVEGIKPGKERRLRFLFPTFAPGTALFYETLHCLRQPGECVLRAVVARTGKAQ